MLWLSPWHSREAVSEPMDSPDLKAPQHYINRELSFLEFNQRVLDQAFDESVPLLERLRFYGIAQATYERLYQRLFNQALADAITTARL